MRTQILRNKCKTLFMAGLLTMFFIVFTSVSFADSGFNITNDKLPYVLKSYMLGGRGNRIEVVMLPCDGETHNFELRLIRNNNFSDSASLVEWPLQTYPCEDMKGEKGSISIIREDKDRKLYLNFRINPESEQTYYMNILRFKPKGYDFSLVVEQVLGYESAGTSYTVLSVKGDKIVRKFIDESSSGMWQTSNLEIWDIDKNGYEDAVFTTIREVAESKMGSDTIDINIYPEKKHEIYAVILTTSDSMESLIEKRHELRRSKSCNCPYKFHIYNTNDFTSLRKSYFILGEVVVGKNKAISLLNELRKSTGIKDAYIKRAK